MASHIILSWLLDACVSYISLFLPSNITLQTFKMIARGPACKLKCSKRMILLQHALPFHISFESSISSLMSKLCSLQSICTNIRPQLPSEPDRCFTQGYHLIRWNYNYTAGEPVHVVHQRIKYKHPEKATQ